MRIDKIHPLEGIPKHHWKWCGMNLPSRRPVGPIRKKKKVKPEEMIVEHTSGEFVLYDEKGNLETFSGLESRTLDLA